MPGLHHVEVWVADLEDARTDWGWLLRRLNFSVENEWRDGESWSAGDVYLTVTTSPNLTGPTHDRRSPGVNHLAFKGGSVDDVNAIMMDAPKHGWRTLYHDRFPHAGGADHYAGWLENSAGFKAEIDAQES
jgi:catechol 2,3-dioxygenase-like lactoylglutathione lyase family enzyme